MNSNSLGESGLYAKKALQLYQGLLKFTELVALKNECYP